MPKDIFNNTCSSFGDDHIQPLAKNGSNNRKNIQQLCRASNEAKADKTKGKINGIRFSVIPAGVDNNKKIIGKMKIIK